DMLADKIAESRAAEIERQRRNAPEAVAARIQDHHERQVLVSLARKRANHEADERFRLERAAADPAPPFDDGLLGDILTRPPMPPDRIEGVMPWDASLLVIAQRKAGKTTLLLNAARSLLTGDPFLGRFATIPVTGRVAFMNYEVNAAQLGRWAYETGIDPDRLYTVNLRGRRNPLAHPEDRAELARRMQAHGVESVIVDPFGRAYTGTSQNDAGEVTAFLVDLDQFVRAEVGARDLILAVHAGWDGERTRGSSALEDWGDAFANLTVDDKDQRFFRAKGRDVEIDEDMLAYDAATRTLSLAGTGGRRAQRTITKVHELEVPITRVIRQNPDISVGKIRESLRNDKVPFQDADVTNALEALAARGRINRVEG
ncbi:ATP-binding protein, partial [Streptomyces koyangensis]